MTGPGVPDLNRFKAKLASSGEYTISVYMMRPAARREERSDYTLDIALEGETGAVVEGDFADGLQGGPNFWEVRTTGVQLNPRSDLSAGAARLRGLGTRAVLRNLGCRMAE